MGKRKRLRKIKSGNKRVKKAVATTEAVCNIRMAAMVRVFQIQIEMIKAAKLVKSGAPPGEIIPIMLQESVLNTEEQKKLFNALKVTCSQKNGEADSGDKNHV